MRIIILILSMLAVSASWIWMFIELATYIIRDDKFNWWSVGSIVIGTIVTIVTIATDEWSVEK